MVIRRKWNGRGLSSDYTRNPDSDRIDPCCAW